MSEPIKRYDCRTEADQYGGYAAMVQDDEGAWIAHDAHAEEVARLRAERDTAAQDALRAFRVQIMGCCPCGSADIPLSDFEMSDSGSSFKCEAGHIIVVDYRSPEERAREYAANATLRAEVDALKAERDAARETAMDMMIQADEARKLCESAWAKTHHYEEALCLEHGQITALRSGDYARAIEPTKIRDLVQERDDLRAQLTRLQSEKSAAVEGMIASAEALAATTVGIRPHKGLHGETHYPHFKIGVQSFDVGYNGTQEEAEWMAKMFRRALVNFAAALSGGAA